MEVEFKMRYSNDLKDLEDEKEISKTPKMQKFNSENLHQKNNIFFEDGSNQEIFDEENNDKRSTSLKKKNLNKFLYSTDSDKLSIKNSSILKIPLLSYNVFMRPPFIKTKKSDSKNKRNKELMKLINEYKIVCFQEMFDAYSSRKYKIIKAAYEIGYKYYEESSPPGYFEAPLIDGGLLTLSKYPIISSKFFKYNCFCTVDKLSKKGILYTKIIVNNSILHLFNTHLQASYVYTFNKKSKLSYFTRLYQILELKNVLGEVLKNENYYKNDLVIVCGDLNIDSNGYDVDLDEYKKAFKDVLPEIEKSYLDDYDKVTEYDLLMFALNLGDEFEVSDLLKKNFDESPQIKRLVTYADYEICKKTGKRIPIETKFTPNSDYGKGLCLDYILKIVPKDKKKFQKNDLDLKLNSKLVPNIKTCRVKKNFREGDEFSQLSDHYAVQIVLEDYEPRNESLYDF